MLNLNYPHNLKIEYGSEAYIYFVNELLPICENMVSFKSGYTIEGTRYIEYGICEDDYQRISQYIKAKKLKVES